MAVERSYRLLAVPGRQYPLPLALAETIQQKTDRDRVFRAALARDCQIVLVTHRNLWNDQ
jgi:hypothetical protein